MSDLLASDADRERVAERLRTAAAEGRLTADELEERLERAFDARTEGELAPLVADLPRVCSPAPPAAGFPPPAARTPGAGSGRPHSAPPDRGLFAGSQLSPFVAVSLLLVAIWALGGAGYFWPVWPIVGWGLFAVGPCGAGRRRACGAGHRRRGTLRA